MPRKPSFNLVTVIANRDGKNAKRIKLTKMERLDDLNKRKWIIGQSSLFVYSRSAFVGECSYIYRSWQFEVFIVDCQLIDRAVDYKSSFLYVALNGKYTVPEISPTVLAPEGGE